MHWLTIFIAGSASPARIADTAKVGFAASMAALHGSVKRQAKSSASSSSLNSTEIQWRSYGVIASTLLQYLCHKPAIKNKRPIDEQCDVTSIK